MDSVVAAAQGFMRSASASGIPRVRRAAATPREQVDTDEFRQSATIRHEHRSGAGGHGVGVQSHLEHHLPAGREGPLHCRRESDDARDPPSGWYQTDTRAPFRDD